MAVEKVALKVVGSVRVSTSDQGDGFSPEIQADKIRAHCRLHDFDLVGVEFDDRSAKDLERPGLRRALARLDSGEARGLVIAKLDRLTRKVRDLDWLLDHYFNEGRGLHLISVTDHIDTTTAPGRLMLNILASVAQWERETIQERVREGHDRARLRGTKAGQIPYGRRAVPTTLTKGKPLEDDPAEQIVLARVLRERGEGRPLREIAAGLTADAIPTKTGRPSWSASSIQSILKRQARNAAVQPPQAEPEAPEAPDA